MAKCEACGLIGLVASAPPQVHLIELTAWSPAPTELASLATLGFVLSRFSHCQLLTNLLVMRLWYVVLHRRLVIVPFTPESTPESPLNDFSRPLIKAPLHYDNNTPNPAACIANTPDFLAFGPSARSGPATAASHGSDSHAYPPTPTQNEP
jgi:hypothetical protein